MLIPGSCGSTLYPTAALGADLFPGWEKNWVNLFHPRLQRSQKDKVYDMWYE